ncbi:anthranilate phosphoribosyltransferase [Sphingorhabdus lutea]|uniref:Anthranilate phosphoribosyltransferase n=1 Tax=Sphingorhabdus lutea TaxID=1913578 RepID=A0A1L3JC24_9SPHN|nr:anthranilate phosphoribosyltransferase [Sphingorhabdus lutea]APG62613.1 anthranilate phosphoribosyltransferase [Sphingorhabdus lutea]
MSDIDFNYMLSGNMPHDEIERHLINLADRGETADDIVAAATAMRDHMVKANAPKNSIDVCGTGGDGQHSLNISTAASIIIASMDIPVAKHGNRAASSKAGAADTLEALGINLETHDAQKSLNEIGIGFFFAQKYHPALGAIAPIRKKIGRRTIFNLLGPLCNPCGVKRQLIGVAHPDIIPIYAEAMLKLGYEKAIIVSGNEGLDEISIAGQSSIATIDGGKITYDIIHPEQFDIPPSPLSAIKGGDAAYNATQLRQLLMGERSAYHYAVLLNVAAALMVSDMAESWEDGIEEASETIDKGLPNALLNCWIAQ